MRRILFSVLLLLIANVAQARELTPQVRAMIFRPTDRVHLSRPTVTIPLRGTDRSGYYKCPYLQVYVNGRGPFTFLFDTGASYTLVSSRVVAAARGRTMFDRDPPDRDVVRLANVDLGGVTLENLWAVVDDSFGVDGVLGFQSLGAASFMFDLASRELVVSERPIVLNGGFTLAYDMRHGVPTVPMNIGNRTIQTLIDTGDDAYALELRSDELGTAALAHSPILAANVQNGANLQRSSVTTLVEPIGLGPVHADSAVVAINDSLPVGDIGYEVLRQFRIAFDPGRRVSTFQPLFAGTRFEIRGGRTAGFTLSLSTGRVSRVMAGLPAERAGLAEGDTILTVDNRPIGDFGPRAWDARLAGASPLLVRWSHDGVVHEAQLSIGELR